MRLKLVQVFNDENNGRQRTKISIRNAHSLEPLTQVSLEGKEIPIFSK